ncbi:MAG TPA: transcription/translation regulatory transformer protein RfaH, partial [Pseudomonas sp.]|nr:transcription/translation regulatory transformer protein RfaH [Pseudomonas sp.]
GFCFEGAVAIDGEVITQLRKRAERVEPFPSLAPGETVRIASGPFADMEAIFYAMDGSERVILLLKLLQREHRVRMPMSGVVKLK